MVWTKNTGMRKAVTWVSLLLIILGILTTVGAGFLTVIVGVLMIVSPILSYAFRTMRKAVERAGSSAYTLDIVGEPQVSGKGMNSYVSIGGLKLATTGKGFANVIRQFHSGSVSLSCVIINQKSRWLGGGAQGEWGLVVAIGGRTLPSPFSTMVTGL